MGSGSSP
nr:TPA_asm: m114.5 sORF 3 [Murid betaherpesvirus 1]DBA07891.1 TPA_asm: m114.5 sORF 3 [Murid betaherpesvirus 1]